MKSYSRNYDRALVVGVDETIYYVNTGTGKIIWSFCSGSSVYSSFQLPKHEDEKMKVFDCEGNWELSVHGIDLKKVVCLQDGRSLVSRLQNAFPRDRVLSLSSPRYNLMYDAKKNVLRFHSSYEEEKMFALPASSNRVEYENSAQSIYITLAIILILGVGVFVFFFISRKLKNRRNLEATPKRCICSLSDLDTLYASQNQGEQIQRAGDMQLLGITTHDHSQTGHEPLDSEEDEQIGQEEDPELVKRTSKQRQRAIQAARGRRKAITSRNTYKDKGGKSSSSKVQEQMNDW